MDFSSIEGVRGVPSGGTAGNKTKDMNQLNQADFMTMMLAQLKAQDPFKPTDNGEFLAQMAQLSTATGVAEVKDAITSLGDSMRSAQILNASSLVGREVVVASDTVTLNEGEGIRGQVPLLGYAQDVKVELLSLNGEVLAQQSLGSHPGGNVPFEWSGVLANGEPLPAGSYKIQVTANNGAFSEAITPEIKARVTSISVPATGAEPQLHLQGLGSLLLSAVRAIS
ncbi:MAG: flagellar hook capping FlgD N-terminal domain-containing protein [Moraxellaceae bacterium]|nr:flagellar hook capping FlgD N-terminal domain-containing protein [Moraxellaceae bacterium]